jgi:glycosyltransferase involved in cell wall biosynthesis
LNNICIVVPVYNNPKTVRSVVEGLLSLKLNIVVVDDGSTIPVSTLLNELECAVITHEVNKGKGCALVSGAKWAKEHNFSHFMSVDADGQHFLSDAKKVLDSFEAKNEIIIGKRDFDSVVVPKASSIGRFLGNLMVYLETGVWVSDTQSGLRIYPLSIFDEPFKSNGYEFEIESLVRHLQRDGSLRMIDIKTVYPEDRVTHFHKVRDNFKMTVLHIKLLIFRLLGVRN